MDLIKYIKFIYISLLFLVWSTSETMHTEDLSLSQEQPPISFSELQRLVEFNNYIFEIRHFYL